MGTATSSELPAPRLLIEPLSPRELEVLALIEAGNSNQAIAARLFISLPTAKRHISNIYAKLGVDSRTQAVARAKELRLLN
jgi:LuxR family maltose regulon positive regulatory protein